MISGSRLFISLFFLIPTLAFSEIRVGGTESDDSTSSHIEDGGKTKHPIADENLLKQGRDAIRDMETRYRANFSKTVRVAVDKLMSALDKGDLDVALSGILTGNEAFTDVENKEVFGTLLENLSPGDSRTIAVEYTQSRKKLRNDLLKAIEDELKGRSDLRSPALATAIRMAGKENLAAYDEAIVTINTNFKKNPKERTRPICFTCGEPVSLDDNYEFYSKMYDATHAALLEEKLDNEKGKGPFFNGRFGRTSTGKIVLVDLAQNGNITARTAANNTPEEQKTNGEDTGLVRETRTLYLNMLKKANGVYPSQWTPAQKQSVANFLMRTEPTSANQSPNTPTPAGQTGSGVTAGNAGSLGGSVRAYLSSLAGRTPDPKRFADPGEMAKVVGLIDKNGKPYVKWKGPGKHWDGTSEYGVQILWDEINKAPKEEQERVKGILTEIKNGAIESYKIVNGNDGYCLWCNLRNDANSLLNLR